MSKDKWKWKDGRLYHPSGKFSLRINEAYHQIPVNEDIRQACVNRLIPYTVKRDELSRKENQNE